MTKKEGFNSRVWYTNLLSKQPKGLSHIQQVYELDVNACYYLSGELQRNPTLDLARLGQFYRLMDITLQEYQAADVSGFCQRLQDTTVELYGRPLRLSAALALCHLVTRVIDHRNPDRMRDVSSVYLKHLRPLVHQLAVEEFYLKPRTLPNSQTPF